MPNLNAIDEQLARLGTVPSDVSALIARHAGHTGRISLAQADSWLLELGARVKLPAQLEPTVVGMEAPAGLELPVPPAAVQLAQAPAKADTARMFPWDSEVPEDTEVIPTTTVRPAPQAEATVELAPAAALDEVAEPARTRRDTIEDGPAIAAAGLTPAPALEVQNNAGPTEPPGASDAPDEFEILVDDEVLEDEEA